MKYKKRVKKAFHKNLFFNAKHSKYGIVSTILSAISASLIIFGVLFSISKDANAGERLGIFPLSSIIIAIFSIYIGFMGFKEEEKTHTYSKVGIIASFIIATFVCLLFAIGISDGG